MDKGKNMPDYEAVIGLETHIQLNTQTKIFCACKTDSWSAAPNSNICPVCSGLPGVLPVLNRLVVEKAVLLAEAMRAQIQPISHFDRKNYFYPDLPKGYQISQFDMPIATGGYINLPVPASADPQGQGYIRKINITKLHIEEDAGKTINQGATRLVDFNRCGIPLVEMVTEPDLRSADEAAQYLIRLRQLLRWLGISEADMEKGNLRCDANVSIRIKGETKLNQKTEIKNVNSIDAVREAIKKEIERQIREVESGNAIKAWTLEWDETRGVLRKMRSKETEADYRYFREPDLLPLEINSEWKQKILEKFPERPLDRRMRFTQEYGLPEYDADILTSERSLSDYFEKTVSTYGGEPKRISNWLMNDVLRMLNELGINADQLKLTPQYLADLIKLIDEGKININTGKDLLLKIQESGKSPLDLIMQLGLAKISDDSAIRMVCEVVIAESPNETASYKSGKLGLMGWFTGQVMKKMGGKADAGIVKNILDGLLK
jgi:aspartyl-tRNA(Asn)/glutamyl-tRNA(Gln) amidotransferase subunit B